MLHCIALYVSLYYDIIIIVLRFIVGLLNLIIFYFTIFGHIYFIIFLYE